MLTVILITNSEEHLFIKIRAKNSNEGFYQWKSMIDDYRRMIHPTTWWVFFSKTVSIDIFSQIVLCNKPSGSSGCFVIMMAWSPPLPVCKCCHVFGVKVLLIYLINIRQTDSSFTIYKKWSGFVISNVRILFFFLCFVWQLMVYVKNNRCIMYSSASPLQHPEGEVSFYLGGSVLVNIQFSWQGMRK